MQRASQSIRPAELAERVALAAAVAAPLYFAVFTQRIFEAEKAGVVRFLGVLAVAALAMGGATGRDAAPRRSVARGVLARSPLARAAVALWLAAALGTALSVAPLASLFGSSERGQGLLTETALATLGAAAAVLAARPGGTARLAAWIGASALPAGLYGLVQRAGLDPVPWLGDVVTRVSGPAGASPLYAAHLAMALPFAAWRAGAAWRRARAAPSAAHQAALAAWLATLAAGGAGVVLSGSRGPAAGLIVGLLAAALAAAARRGHRRAAGAAVGALLLGAALLVALNRAPAAFGPLARLPLVDRLSTALDPERSTTRVRLRLWEGSVAALGDRPDRLATGFGPETMPLIWAPYYPPILAYDEPRGRVPDRAHNLALDTLLTSGVLGLAALLWFLAAVLEAALAELGLAPGRAGPAGAVRRGPGGVAARRAAWLATGLTAAGAARLLDGSWRLAGPAFGLGLVAGMLASIARAARDPARHPARVERAEGFALAALAAVVAHVVETQVGFPATATRLVLWLAAGALLGRAMAAAESGGPTDARDPSLDARPADADAQAPWPETARAALLVGGTLIFDLARPGLATGGGAVVAALVVLSVFGVGAALGAAAWTLRRAAAVAAALLGFAGLQAVVLATLAGTTGETGAGVAASLALYALGLAALVAWPAAPDGPRAGAEGAHAHGSAAEPGAGPDPSARPGAPWAVLLVAGAAALPLWLAPSLADALVKEGRLSWEARALEERARGRGGRAEALLGEATARYGSAMRLAPWAPEHALARAFGRDVAAGLLDERLGRALADAGRSDAADEYDADLLEGAARRLAAGRDDAFAAALADMARAQRLSGPAPGPVLARARALRVWGDMTRQPAHRAARLEEARAAYAEAAARAPGWPEVLDEGALTARLAGDPAAAVTLARRALALDPYFSRAWKTAADAEAARGEPAAAAAAWARYFRDDRNAGDVPALRAYLAVLVATGRDADALGVARDVVRLAPGDAFGHADLATVLERLGRREEARAAAEAAARLAPDDPGIGALRARLGGDAPD